MSNHLGSTACIFPLTGLNRTPIAQQITDAYGIPVTLQGAVDPQRSRTSFIGRDVDKESDLGAFGARLYSSEYGRFVAVDKLWEKHSSFSAYNYAFNRPSIYCDYTGLDSAQRSRALEKAREYLESESTYLFGAKGAPGSPVDCSGMVSKCIVAGGEKDPVLVGRGKTGVIRIENSTTEVQASDVEPGNVVTFRTNANHAQHTGIVTSVEHAENGTINSLTFIHANSKNKGVTEQTVSPSDKKD